MRIGVVGPIWLNIPPTTYGGTEEVVYNLVNGLVDQGHDVTLFGPATARTKAKLIPTTEKPLREIDIPWTDIGYNLFHMTKAFDMANQFDILHIHLNKTPDYVAFPLALQSPIPVLFTIHFKLFTDTDHADRKQLLMKYKEFPFTSISNSQRTPLPLNFIQTIYNGLTIVDYPFVQEPEEYLVWLGKVNPLKGTKEAILAAKQAGKKIKIMGAVETGVPTMLSYYENEIKPLIDNQQVIWLGQVGLPEKATVLGHARGFLNPIQWEEPFGLVMAESQATGTPVISFAKGAAPEVIQDGKTGFLVNTLDEMVEKIKQLDTLKRQDCRKNIEINFTNDSMVKGYEKAYQTTIMHWKEYVKKQQDSLQS